MTRCHFTPASTRAVRRSGSMNRPCIRRVVTITEPAALRTGPCPVAWTATPRPCATAQETAAATSAAQVAPDRDRRGVLHGDVPGGDLGGEAVVAGGVDRAVHEAAQLLDVLGGERLRQGRDGHGAGGHRFVQDDGRLGPTGLGERHGVPSRGRGGSRGSGRRVGRGWRDARRVGRPA